MANTTPVDLPETPSSDPKENLKRYCARVGLNESDFVELPRRPGRFVGSPDLTPEVCKQMEAVSLQRNGHNRKLRLVAVEQYRNFINMDGLDLTGQTIVISDLWSLLDGHHRTTAGTEASKSFPATVYFGTPDRMFSIIDNAAGRSLADNMELAGVGRYSWLAQAIDLLITYEKTNPHDVMGTLTVAMDGRTRNQFVVDHKAEIEWVRDQTKAIEQELPIPMPEVACHLYLSRLLNQERTESFIEGLLTGVFPAAGDARLAYSKWCRDAEKIRQDHPKKAPKRADKVKAISTALQCWLDNVPLDTITVGKKKKAKKKAPVLVAAAA